MAGDMFLKKHCRVVLYKKQEIIVFFPCIKLTHVLMFKSELRVLMTVTWSISGVFR